MTRPASTLLLILAFSFGCGDTGPSLDASVDQSVDAGCAPGTLSQYCDGACHTYAELLASLASKPCWEREFLVTGTCGALRYVQYSPHGIDGTTEFFDASGNLVAVHYDSDTNDQCGGTSFDSFYGEVPDCQLVADADGGPQTCSEPDGGTGD